MRKLPIQASSRNTLSSLSIVSPPLQIADFPVLKHCSCIALYRQRCSRFPHLPRVQLSYFSSSWRSTIFEADSSG